MTHTRSVVTSLVIAVWKAFSIVAGSAMLMLLAISFFGIISSAFGLLSNFVLESVKLSIIHIAETEGLSMLERFVYRNGYLLLELALVLVVPWVWELLTHFYLAVVVFRYTARFFPLELQPNNTRARPFKGAYPILAALVGVTVAIFSILVSLSKGWPNIIKSTIDIAIFAATFMLLAVRHYNGTDFTATKKWALVLRRFSSFADRELLPLLLARISPDFRAVLLVPENEPAANWDPLTVGLAGFHPLVPIQTIPVVVRAANACWIDSVSKLLDDSKLVLIDTSDVSDSMRSEIELIHGKNATSRTIELRERKEAPAKEFCPGESSELKAVTKIYYERCFLRAIPRILGNLALLALLALLAYLPCTKIIESDVTVRPWVLSAYGLLVGFLTLYFVKTFVRPTIDGLARKRISETIRCLRY